MSKYLLIYNYIGNYEEHTTESSEENYLNFKVNEIVGLSGFGIDYKILKVVDEGTLEYRGMED